MQAQSFTHDVPASVCDRIDEYNGLFSVALTAGLAIGVRPCAGSIFVLIAALDQQRFGVGVICAFAMSVGVALTVCLIGLTSRGINRTLAVEGIRKRMRIERVRRRLALSGALIITGFATWQLLALTIGWRVLSLT